MHVYQGLSVSLQLMRKEAYYANQWMVDHLCSV